jgi:hypothetical protein
MLLRGQIFFNALLSFCTARFFHLELNFTSDQLLAVPGLLSIRLYNIRKSVKHNPT